jgi:hypothetical protein
LGLALKPGEFSDVQRFVRNWHETSAGADAWKSQAMKDSMEGDGIDMSSVRIEYLDEIDSARVDNKACVGSPRRGF